LDNSLICLLFSQFAEPLHPFREGILTFRPLQAEYLLLDSRVAPKAVTLELLGRVRSGVIWAKAQLTEDAITPPIAKKLTSPNFQP
jgi:hypothetical protein